MGSKTRPGAPPLPLGNNMMGQSIPNQMQPEQRAPMRPDPRMGSTQGQDYILNRILGQQPGMQQQNPMGQAYGQPAMPADPMLNGQPMPSGIGPRRRLFRGGGY